MRSREEQPKVRIRIRLACGCHVLARENPFNPTAKFLCRSGMGHSYNQPWVSYVDTEGAMHENKPK